MTEYIKKEDIEQKIQDGLNNLVLGHDAIEVLGMIYEMPAADFAPVRHGRWEVEVGMNFYKERNCPVCKKRIESNFWNYCPNCGAQMDLHDECGQDVER